MSSVIEHRDSEGVLGAFVSTGATKFAIWQGTVPVMVFDEQHPDYEDGNSELALDKLTEWLNFIDQGGTTAVYALRVYPADTKNITNKTPFRAATRFQLTPAKGADYQTTPDGRVIMIRDQNRSVGNTNANAGNNPLLQQLIDNQNKMMELFISSQKQQQETKLDKLIGFLEQGFNKPAEESTVDKLVMLGKNVIENPEIIDRIGYIIRPSLYSREAVAEPISGTTQQAAPQAAQTQQNMDDQNGTPSQEPQEQQLTDAEIDALYLRQEEAIDTLQELVGIEDITDALEKLATKTEAQLKALIAML